eukprot:jgi/Botrbrau1/23370/Bobra.0051s0022.1
MTEALQHKRMSRRPKKPPDFFVAEPASFNGPGEFARPHPSPTRKRRANSKPHNARKRVKEGSSEEGGEEPCMVGTPHAAAQTIIVPCPADQTSSQLIASNITEGGAAGISESIKHVHSTSMGPSPNCSIEEDAQKTCRVLPAQAAPDSPNAVPYTVCEASRLDVGTVTGGTRNSKSPTAHKICMVSTSQAATDSPNVVPCAACETLQLDVGTVTGGTRRISQSPAGAHNTTVVASVSSPQGSEKAVAVSSPLEGPHNGDVTGCIPGPSASSVHPELEVPHLSQDQCHSQAQQCLEPGRTKQTNIGQLPSMLQSLSGSVGPKADPRPKSTQVGKTFSLGTFAPLKKGNSGPPDAGTMPPLRAPIADSRRSPVTLTNGNDSDCAIEASPAALEQQKRRQRLEKELQKLLVNLSKTKESIAKVTNHILNGVESGVAASYCRIIVEEIKAEPSGARRINLLYLMDSVIQTSQRPSRPKCGPDSEAGQAFRRLGAAALPGLIPAVAAEGEGLEKARKVLNLWLDRGLLPASVINVQLQLLNSMKVASPGRSKHVVTIPQSTPGLPDISAELDNQYGSMNTAAALQVVSDGVPTVSLHIHLKDDGEAWEDDVEEDDANDNVLSEASPKWTSETASWNHISPNTCGPDGSEESPWQSGTSNGPSPFEKGGRFSLSEVLPDLAFDGATGPVKSLSPGAEGSNVMQIPRLLYDPPVSDVVRLSAQFAAKTAYVEDVMSEDEDWDPPQFPSLQTEAFGSLPPGLMSPTSNTAGVQHGMKWGALPPGLDIGDDGSTAAGLPCSSDLDSAQTKLPVPPHQVEVAAVLDLQGNGAPLSHGDPSYHHKRMAPTDAGRAEMFHTQVSMQIEAEQGSVSYYGGATLAGNVGADTTARASSETYMESFAVQDNMYSYTALNTQAPARIDGPNSQLYAAHLQFHAVDPVVQEYNGELGLNAPMCLAIPGEELPPLPVEPPLPDEEAPPLPEGEPPLPPEDPPLPPDSPLDESLQRGINIRSPTPSSPPPLPPDDDGDLHFLQEQHAGAPAVYEGLLLAGTLAVSDIAQRVDTSAHGHSTGSYPARANEVRPWLTSASHPLQESGSQCSNYWEQPGNPPVAAGYASFAFTSSGQG